MRAAYIILQFPRTENLFAVGIVYWSLRGEAFPPVAKSGIGVGRRTGLWTPVFLGLKFDWLDWLFILIGKM